ncbi:MAG: tyrosine-type recombinase/integrase [Janthinobacterium lividum]
MGKLGSRDLASLGPNSEIWDQGKGSVSGFGARRQKSESISFVLLYRNPDGRSRRVTIGRYGKMTPDEARLEAKKLQGRVATGEDPAEAKQERRKAATVAELCDAYFEDIQAGRVLTKARRAKKASTIAIDRTRIERHVKPLIGSLKVKAVTRDDIDRFMHRVAEGESAEIAAASKKSRTTGGAGTASRTVGMLGAVFDYAVKKHMREDNPCRGVVRFADNKRERRMTDAEYAVFGSGLRAAEGDFVPAALAAARFLAFTGWRRGEMLGLTWPDVDTARRTATLPDTKTGRSVRALSAAACAVLTALPRSGAYVFPAVRGDARMTSFQNVFVRLVAASDLPPDITPHVLRHSFASVAADLGYSESTIGALIGHKSGTMTSRYVHHADPVLVAAADAVAGRIEALMAHEREQAR